MNVYVGTSGVLKNAYIGEFLYKYLTFTLDQTQSNPSNMITAVSDDAINMTQQQVIDFIGAYPVLLANDGTEYKKLNPNNFQQFEDGTDASSYTASTSYDVMIKFPRRGYKISTSNNITTFSLTDNPNDPDYCYYPFQRITSGSLGSGSETFNNASAFYLGAYKGINSSGLRSRYNQTITTSQTIGTYAGYARNRGNLRGIIEFVQETYLEILFMAIYKTTNAQSAIGQGYTNPYNTSSKITGGTYNKGMTWGGANSEQMKFLGIEDRYGNVWDIVNGWGQTSSGIYISIPNADGSNRTSSYSYTPSNCSAAQSSISITSLSYITKVRGDNLCGFIPTATSGSDSTYFTDYARRDFGSRVALFGGQFSLASWCGAFCLALNFDASITDITIGSRLMYLPNGDLTL